MPNTLLRLPTGILYAQGVKANVLFFDRKPAQEKPWTSKLWIYDLRTNQHFTVKENTLKRSDLDDFVACYNPKNRHDRKESERFKCFTYEELIKRDNRWSNPARPASLDTLRISVPPAVKLAAAIGAQSALKPRHLLAQRRSRAESAKRKSEI